MAATPAGLKRFYLLLGAVAVVGGIALLTMLRGKPVSIPANVTVQASDTAGFRGYILGSETAPIEITEYGDYQCPACASFDIVQFPSVRERLIDAGKVRWRFRDFPIDGHRHSRIAAHATACASDQGKYWEAHRFIYESQTDWFAKQSAVDDFRDIMKAIGMDLAQYDDCMKTAKYAGRIQASYDEGMKTGIGSTPSFLIGGRIYPGALPYDEIKRIVDSLAAAAPAAPAAAPAPAGAN